MVKNEQLKEKQLFPVGEANVLIKTSSSVKVIYQC